MFAPKKGPMGTIGSSENVLGDSLSCTLCCIAHCARDAFCGVAKGVANSSDCDGSVVDAEEKHAGLKRDMSYRHCQQYQ